MIIQKSHAITSLLVVIILTLSFYSCVVIKMDSIPEKPFSSLANEQLFWDQWIKARHDKTCPLEPFFTRSNSNLLVQANEKLVTLSGEADIFLLTIRTSINDGTLDIIAVIKTDRWRQISWSSTGDDKFTESVSEKSDVDEMLCEAISKHPFFVDMADWMTLDSDSTYLFLNYKGKFSRFAIYDLDFTKEKRKRGGRIICLLETLFSKSGLLKREAKAEGRSESAD